MDDTGSEIDKVTDAAANGAIRLDGGVISADNYAIALGGTYNTASPVSFKFDFKASQAVVDEMLAGYHYTEPFRMKGEMLGSSDGGVGKDDVASVDMKRVMDDYRKPPGVTQRYAIAPRYEAYTTTAHQVSVAEAVREALAAISYKPGWTFELVTGFGESYGFSTYGYDLMVRIQFEAEDTYHPGQVTKVGTQEILPETFRLQWDATAFYRWIQRRVHFLECHEADEMLLVGGERIFDPHKPRHPWKTTLSVA